MHLKSLPAALIALAIAASPAWAHIGPEHHASFASGFMHPLGGLDHILAMVAVGLYAATLGGRALWLVPAAFVGTMIAGGALGYAGVPLPYVEQGIGLSVVAMGLAVALGLRLPTVVAMGLVGAFALFHGHAHGSEGLSLAGSTAPLTAFAAFAAGFVLATCVLHLAGIAIGLGSEHLGRDRSQMVRRAAGTFGTVAGISLLAGWLAV